MTAEPHRSRVQQIIRGTQTRLAGLWSFLNPDELATSFDSWQPGLVRAIRDGQFYAAQEADTYLSIHTGLDGELDLNPDAFGDGWTADGRDMATMVRLSLDDALDAVYDGTHPPESSSAGLRGKAAGWDRLQRRAGQEVRDAARTADGVAMVSRPEVKGYVRHLSLPSCPKCVVLAGRVYKWNEGFQRHPACDCFHVPVLESEEGTATDPRKAIESGQVHGLSNSDRQAILDGADVSQVINAHKSMYTAADGSKATRLDNRASRRGRPATVRLRPESIYAMADGNRARAIELLREHRYLT